MKIETIPIDDITPYAGNAKNHPDWQIDQIRESMARFGNNDPIAIDARGVIVEGHGRYEALVRNGATHADVIRLEHLDEQEAAAYRLAHNKTAMNTGFDMDALDRELSKLADMDMAAFGFELISPIDLDEVGSKNKDLDDTNMCTCPKCGFRFVP